MPPSRGAYAIVVTRLPCQKPATDVNLALRNRRASKVNATGVVMLIRPMVP